MEVLQGDSLHQSLPAAAGAQTQPLVPLDRDHVGYELAAVCYERHLAG